MTRRELREIPITALALSLSGFLGITFLLCVAIAFLVPDSGTHALLQFFPRFSWTDAGIHHGIVWSLAYGFYAATVFGALFNFFARRGRAGEARPATSNV